MSKSSLSTGDVPDADEVDVSVIIHTLNPGPLLRPCLASVAWAAEVVVLDMGSDDGSRDLAVAHGARVLEVDRVPYVELQRQFGLKQATRPWTLVLDADEVVSRALARRIHDIIDAGDTDAAALPRRNYFFGKAAKHGAFGPQRDLQLRLFRTGFASWPETIHAVPRLPEGARVVSDLRPDSECLLHFAYASPSDFLRKVDRYTEIESHRVANLRRVASSFYGDYVRRRGYRDGRLGLQLAVLMCAYQVVVDGKGQLASGYGDVQGVEEHYLRLGEAAT